MKTCPQCGSQYDLDLKFCPRDGSTLRVPAGSDIIGAVIADRYHVLKKLGEGGMGQVYLAEHVKMGRMSAIKLMNPSMAQDADAIGRFNREAANAASLNHPNIAAIYDFGETDDGLIYLAMEYVEGAPLTKLLQEAGALPAPRAAEIARQVASALDAAHARGIVHRDLKPDNIMVVRNPDGTDTVKLVDFGIAKAQGEGQKVTKTGLVVGTPEYMSPEQISGDPLDGRSDTYSLALVTFHMLTGLLPFPSTTLQEAMIMRLTDRPRTLQEMRSDVDWPVPLQHVLDRGLARDRNERYEKAGDFAFDLSRAAFGMPATAPGSPTAAATRPVASVPPTRPGAAMGSTPPTRPSASVTPPAPRRRWALPLGVLGGALLAGGAVWLTLGHGAPAPAAKPSKPVVVAQADTTRLMRRTDSVLEERDSTLEKRDSALAARHSAADSETPPVAPTHKTHAAEIPRRTEAKPHPRPPAPSANIQPSAEQRVPSPAVSSPAVSSAERPAPSAEPVAPPDFESMSADRARQAVSEASQLLNQQRTDAALLMLRGAMRRLPTRDDSISALYYMSQGLVQKADRENDAPARARACAILRLIRRDPQHKLAADIRNLYQSQACN